MNIQKLEDKHDYESISELFLNTSNSKNHTKLSVEFALNLVKEILKTDYEHRAGKAIEIRDKLWDYLTIRLKEGDKCPHCEEGKIIFIKGNEPYDIDHLMCDFCDSTYNL